MNDGCFPLPATAKRGTCRSCQQPVAWVTTGSGAHMPLDLATVEQRDGVTMAMNHFAVCPQGKAWSTRSAYRGPTGDIANPEAQAAVAQLELLREGYGL